MNVRIAFSCALFFLVHANSYAGRNAINPVVLPQQSEQPSDPPGFVPLALHLINFGTEAAAGKVTGNDINAPCSEVYKIIQEKSLEPALDQCHAMAPVIDWIRHIASTRVEASAGAVLNNHDSSSLPPPSGVAVRRLDRIRAMVQSDG